VEAHLVNIINKKMRSFPLYDLNDQEFEKLVVLICERILGSGTINFSTGADAGRDAKFTGKAQNFPSKTSPWEGKFIIKYAEAG
jgi:hypothetical protein